MEASTSCACETMVRSKGRSKDKNTIKGKPTSIGYTLYTLAACGYLLAFDLTVTTERRSTDQGVLHSAIINLVRPWFNSHHIVFSDNLYTSPALCDHLLREGLFSCGTCRGNRCGLPSTARDDMDRLEKGAVKTWRRGDLQCLAWHDSKPILFLSTFQKIDEIDTRESKRGPRPRPGVIKPYIAHEYNQHKCHVDTVDQLRQSYAILRRHRKTWPALAWWLVDMCVINAYTLYCVNTKTVISQLQFRRALLQQLWETYGSASTTHAHSGRPVAVSTLNSHWPTRADKMLDCAHCSSRSSQRVRTKTECKSRGVHLCVDDCFEQYHVKRFRLS